MRKYSNDRWRNSGETLAYFCTLKIAKWAYPAYYLGTCLTDLDHIFTFDRHVGEDD